MNSLNRIIIFMFLVVSRIRDQISWQIGFLHLEDIDAFYVLEAWHILTFILYIQGESKKGLLWLKNLKKDISDHKIKTNTNLNDCTIYFLSSAKDITLFDDTIK